MLQSIVTKFLGPTNTMEPRVTAKCNAGRVYIKFDPRKTPDQNHVEAARKLASRLGWYGKFVGGALPHSSGGCVFVVETDDPRDSFFVGNES